MSAKASGDDAKGKAALEQIMLAMSEAGSLAVKRIREDGRIAFGLASPRDISQGSS